MGKNSVLGKTELLLRIASLIAREQLSELSPDEYMELRSWLRADEKNRNLYQKLKNEKIIAESILEMEKYDSEKAFSVIADRLSAKNNTRSVFHIPVIYKYAAAILLLICGGLLTFFLIGRHSTATHLVINQIHPGTQKAFLTTSDNQRIALGETDQRSVIHDGNVIIVDTGATLKYQFGKETSLDENGEIEYNQLEIPRGGEYTLILSDGSQIKLNSQTRLRFPVQFDKKSRFVELEGEAFFEIADYGNIPFIVNTKGMRITVYGTAFNVSAYSDDEYIQTTLVRGSVGISIPGSSQPVEYKLKPGQQANYNKVRDEVETIEVNLIQFTAWTRGTYVFENESLEQILQKLARWYDCEIEFRDDALRHESFTGELKRFDSFSTILDMISVASDVKFKSEGKRIIVLPEK